ncbi:glycosyltransferase family 4 protein [Tahibacter harae]|uniref:Glycosyltransferase family 4 protein n=1 Tax=Tahibacter harae TaxID=2963937 RepID=A0ABT1QTR6_9GAMM|nr:glycosyltransferase family 4 protein [Tahibacter harae]MCQ4165675.1 glycosyltransferase family 4 protein [Tahibacter harae]
MKRIAIVVQRCHRDVAGGSEALAWHYAQLLRARCDVEILTSCALDYRSWDNALPAGSEEHDGITIRRFPSAWPRGSWFGELHRRLLQAHAVHVEQRGEAEIPWRAPLAEQFVRAQGPWCPGLLDHLHARHAGYDAVLFCTYLYPTTYFAMECVPAHKRVLIPTLHDEPPAYLAIYARAAQRAARIVWLTEAERRLGRRLWGTEAGAVVGMAVPVHPAAAVERELPYLLYCGRIDESKGCRELIAAFRELRARRRGAVELVLTGADHLGLRPGDGVHFLGFVDEAQKRRLMAGARAFVMPSRWESFSIVTLEALAQGTPVVVNGDCEVLADHVAQSRAGWSYRGSEELQGCLAQALDLAAEQRAVMGANARNYVAEQFEHEAVAHRLYAAIGTAGATQPPL